MNAAFADDPFIDAILQFRKEELKRGCCDPLVVPLTSSVGLATKDLTGRFPDLGGPFGATLSMAMRSDLIARAQRLENALMLCESPIEARFLLALVCACLRNELAVTILSDEDGLELFGCEGVHGDMLLHVTPQMEIGQHRVDFALELTFTHPLHEMADLFGTDNPKYLPEQVSDKLVIECDGHEFHDKTRDQAKRDKSRDRNLLQLGYPVMRFTGSEIHANPLLYAEQVVHGFFEINKLPEE